MKKIIITTLFGLIAVVAQASVVISWRADNTSGSLPYDTIDDNMAISSGLNEVSRHGVDYYDQNFAYASTGWNNNTDTLDVNNYYLSFSISPSEGYEVNLQELTYYINGGNPAPGTGQWGYSTNGGSSWTFSDTIHIQSSSSPEEHWDFNDFTVQSGTTVEFRFWAYGSSNVNNNPTVTPNTAPIRLYNNGEQNELILNGVVSQIPEARSYALMAAASALLFVLLRRRLRK